MAAASGGSDPPLIDRLCNEPHRFEFSQAARLLEQYAGEYAAQRGRFAHGPVGEDEQPGTEAIRFRTQPGLSFPASSISRIRDLSRGAVDADDPVRQFELWVTFFGLNAPSGALPQHYTALLLRRMRDKDFALRDFFDQFNHRLLSLFYRAERKYRWPMAFEHARRRGQYDDCTQAQLCLVGLGTERLRRPATVEDEAVLYYSGHFARYPRSARGLEDVLEDFLGLPVDVRQFQGQWLRISEDDRSALLGRRSDRPSSMRLGSDAILGERVWDVQSKIRLRIGPVDYEQFRRFLPNGSALAQLRELARLYVGPTLDFDVQLVLRRSETPRIQLGGSATDQPRLGWNTWLRSKPVNHDPEDAVFADNDLK